MYSGMMFPPCCWLRRAASRSDSAWRSEQATRQSSVNEASTARKKCFGLLAELPAGKFFVEKGG
jgi:hypothetical protein